MVYRQFATVKGELLPYAVQQQVSSKNELHPSKKEPLRTDISLEVSPVKDDCEKENRGNFLIFERWTSCSFSFLMNQHIFGRYVFNGNEFRISSDSSIYVKF